MALSLGSKLGSVGAKCVRPQIPIILAICVGCALSTGAYLFTAKLDQKVQQSRFEREAGIRFNQIEKQIDRSISIVSSIVGLYAASPGVDGEEFRAFVKALGEQPTIQALEWIPRVPHVEREAFEKAARRNGFPKFSFTERRSQGSMAPAGKRDEYFPVYYIEPYAGNEAALGFDLGSNEARLEALNRARDSGEMVATSRITLVQETGDQYGFLVFAPIYQNGAPSTTVVERRANLIGFGLGVFRIGGLVSAAISDVSASKAPLAIQIFDHSSPENLTACTLRP